MIDDFKEQFYSNHIKPPKSFFEEGASYFDIVHFKSKGEVISSTLRTRNRRGKKVKFVRLQVNTHFGNFFSLYYIQRYASTKKKVEHQTWCFTREIKLIDGRPVETIKSTLTNLTVWTEDKEYSFKNRQLAGLGWSYDGIWSRQNYENIFKKSPLKHTRIWDICRLDPLMVSRAVKYRVILEILVNLENIKVARRVVENICDMRLMTLNFIKRNKKYLKKGLTEIEILDDIPIVEQYYKLNDEVLSRIVTGSLSRDRINRVLDYEVKNSIRSRKLLRYLDKQKRQLHYYEDYIRMLKEIKRYDRSWKVLFPKSLEDAHDKTNLILFDLKNKEKIEKAIKLNESYSRAVDDLKSLEISGEKYSIVIPKNLEEIITEGKELSHCVYGDKYVEGHAKLTRLIVFVRRSNALDVPYFTLELRSTDCSIVQLHGYRNERQEDPKGLIAKNQKPEVECFAQGIFESADYQKMFKSALKTARKSLKKKQPKSVAIAKSNQIRLSNQT